MQDEIMQVYTYPPEHIGVTWFVIISPILLVLVMAYVAHLRENPPELLVTAYNALLRTKKNLLYIQSLELRIKHLEEVNAALLDQGEAETIPYEEMTLPDEWRKNEKSFYVKQMDETPKAWQGQE